jgi:hypothetical protein
MCRHAHIGQYDTEAGISTQTSTITVSATSVRHLHAQFTRPFMAGCNINIILDRILGMLRGMGVFSYISIYMSWYLSFISRTNLGAGKVTLGRQATQLRHQVYMLN